MKLCMRNIVIQSMDEIEVHDDYEFAPYWRGSNDDQDGGYAQFLVVDEHGIQVARIELDENADREDFISSTYPISEAGDPILEIQMIDVRAPFRGIGVGSWIIEELSKAYPGRVLMALSEGADYFWLSLGWDKVPALDLRLPRKRILFIQR